MGSVIRLARDSDAAALAGIYRPFVESTPISFETDPPDEQEMLRRVDETLPSHPWLVCETRARVVGYAYATKHRVRAAYQWSADVSIYVQSDYHRRGVARGLYTSLLGILEAQGYFNVYAGVTLPNPPSVALHESLGFKAVGAYQNVGYKLGVWHDVGWWQMALRRHAPMPGRPLEVPDVQRSSDWARLIASGESGLRG